MCSSDLIDEPARSADPRRRLLERCRDRRLRCRHRCNGRELAIDDGRHQRIAGPGIELAEARAGVFRGHEPGLHLPWSPTRAVGMSSRQILPLTPTASNHTVRATLAIPSGSRVQPVHAFLLGIASIAVLVVMDALIKHLGQRHSAPALVSIRFVATALWLLPLIILWRIDRPDTSALRRHGLRSALTVVSNGLFFYALAQLPLADVFALSFLGPIFIALLGVAVLGERLDLKGGLAIGMAFLGMLMIVRGGLAGGASGPWPVAGQIGRAHV